jgi:hypothetical protein
LRVIGTGGRVTGAGGGVTDVRVTGTGGGVTSRPPAAARGDASGERPSCRPWQPAARTSTPIRTVPVRVTPYTPPWKVRTRTGIASPAW